MTTPSSHVIEPPLAPRLIGQSFAAEFAFARARHSRPNCSEESVGIFCREYSVDGDIVSDGTGFLWFVSNEAAVTFLIFHLVSFFGSSTPCEPLNVSARCMKHMVGDLDRPTCLREINVLLDCHAKICWWGTYSELLFEYSTPKSFPRTLRALFRGGSSDEAIRDTERHRFLRFVCSYDGE